MNFLIFTYFFDFFLKFFELKINLFNLNSIFFRAGDMAVCKALIARLNRDHQLSLKARGMWCISTRR